MKWSADSSSNSSRSQKSFSFMGAGESKPTEHEAAAKVQAVYRAKTQSNVLSEARSAATKVQAGFRGHKARAEHPKSSPAPANAAALQPGIGVSSYRLQSNLLIEAATPGHSRIQSVGQLVMMAKEKAALEHNEMQLSIVKTEGGSFGMHIADDRRPGSTGWIVRAADPRRLGYQGGIREGDLLVMVNGDRVQSAEHFNRVLR